MGDPGTAEYGEGARRGQTPMEGFSASGGETQGSEADAVERTASGTNGAGSGCEGGAGPLSPPSAAGAGAVKREATPRLYGPCWGGQIAGTECQPVQAKSNAFREHFCASCRSGTIFIPASRLRIVEPGSELANVFTGGVWNEPRFPGRVKQPRPALPAHRVINQTKCSTGAKLVVLQRETAAPLPGLATLGDARSLTPLSPEPHTLHRTRLQRRLLLHLPLPAVAQDGELDARRAEHGRLDGGVPVDGHSVHGEDQVA